MRPRRWVSAALLATALGWNLVLLATPRLAGAESAWARLASALTRSACARLCHQRPDRSFHASGQPLPVCARCSGVYAGAAVGVAGALAAAVRRRRGRDGRSRGRLERWRWPLVAAASPTALTWVLERAGVVAFTNGARFAWALPLGIAAAWAVTAALAGDVE